MLESIHSPFDIEESIREDQRPVATYRDIEAAIRIAVPSKSRAETLLASLRCWNSFSRTSLNCEVGPDLLRLTDDTKLAFLRWMLDDIKLAASTGRKRVQHIAQISTLSQALVAVDRLPGSFSAALKSLCMRFEQSVDRAARAVGVHKSTLAGWLSGHRPQHKHRETVAKLEAYFGIPIGTLTSRAEFLAPVSGKVRKTAFAQRRSEQCTASKDEGKLWIPFEYLQESWTKYLTFKTDEERPEVMYPANKAKPPVWRSKDPSTCGIKPRPQLLLPNGRIVPSAGIAYGHIATYLGWRRRQFAHTEQTAATLAWIVDRKAVFKHAFWKAQRSGGIWHAGIKDFLAQVITMTRPTSGYLWQHPELAFELHEPRVVLGYDPNEVSAAERVSMWQAACELTFHEIKRLVGSKFGSPDKVPLARDPQESIRDMLGDELPLQRFLRRLNDHALRLQLKSWSRHRIHSERDLLVLFLLASNPLRISQYVMMTYRPDGTGNLYQDSEKRWRIRFRAEDFKNTRGAAHKDYDVPVAASLWRRIEVYISKVRPRLQGAGECDFMFLPTAGSARALHAASKRGMWDTEGIVSSLRHTVADAVPEARGFGPHAVRHLVASNYLRARPGDVEGLAAVLNDTIETVRRTYLSRQTEPIFERIATSFDELMLEAGHQ